MFESAEIGAKLSDAAFCEIKGRLRLELIELQQRNRLDTNTPVVLLLSGVRGAGIMDTLNLLNSWMDPRWIQTHAFDTPSDEERERPPFWRYWRTMPAAGNIGLYLGGWYADPLALYADHHLTKAAFLEEMKRVAAFEQTIAEEGALVIKFWLHLSNAAQRRVRHVHATDPQFGFRSSDMAWAQPASYDAYIDAAALAVKHTNVSAAPWRIIEGGDNNFRRAQVLMTLHDAFDRHHKTWRKIAKADAKSIKRAHKNMKQARHAAETRSKTSRLAKVDLSKKLAQAAYNKQFGALQARLYAAQEKARAIGLSTVVVLEGRDAAGKGGAIRRLTYGLNARNYTVVPISAPNDEERAHHYLWRFWRQLQRAGHVTIFDRSWYGRVLVERVDAFIAERAWKRAYDEINDFEHQIAAHNSVVIKFWLHTDKETQRARFKDREKTPYKRWKITDDDWHNRKQWALYTQAAEDMFARTSMPYAPWHIVAADDKHSARIAVLEAVTTAMEQALEARAIPRKAVKK